MQKSLHTILFAVVAVICSFPVLPAEPTSKTNKYLPFDEAESDPGFTRFRNRLVVIIRKKDRQALLKVISPDIRNSFGGNDGIEEFREMHLSAEGQTTFWNDLEQVVTNGGCFVKPEDAGVTKEFWAPYLWCNVIRDKTTESGYSAGVVLGKDVALRKKPDSKSAVIRRLNYEEVMMEECSEKEWLQVTTADGTRGYMPARKLRLWIDYRASFIKKDGKWTINLFLAGD